LRKDFLLKKIVNYKNNDDKIEIKEYAPRINTKKENPLITQEKTKERALHRTIVTSIIHKFSIENYYKLNKLLKDLTLNQLYYHSFIDKKGIQKQIMEQKRDSFLISIKDRVIMKEDSQILKNIVNKVKKNIYLLNSIKKKNINYNYQNQTNFLFEKLLNYLIIEKKIKNISNIIFKVLKIKDVKLNKKKEKLNVNKIFRNVMNDIILKERINKLSFFYDSKDIVLKKDKIEIVKRKLFCSLPKYIERNELEKMDNKLLYNTVKKYNEEKIKKKIN
jgi:hypothetical protein